MNAREIEEQANDIRSKRRRVVESVPLAAACAALAPVAWLWSSPLGIAVAVGGAVQIALAGGAFVSRRLLVERLAIEADAHAIPEVRAFGAKLVRPHERRKLARTICSMLAEVMSPGRRLQALYLADRVYRYARELDAIARDLLSPSVRVDPVSMARCNWLLTQAAENPLFDRRLPAEDLGAILRRIRAGMHPVA